MWLQYSGIMLQLDDFRLLDLEKQFKYQIIGVQETQSKSTQPGPKKLVMNALYTNYTHENGTITRDKAARILKSQMMNGSYVMSFFKIDNELPVNKHWLKCW